jgi:hypothetical protein
LEKTYYKDGVVVVISKVVGLASKNLFVFAICLKVLLIYIFFPKIPRKIPRKFAIGENWEILPETVHKNLLA